MQRKTARGDRGYQTLAGATVEHSNRKPCNRHGTARHASTMAHGGFANPRHRAKTKRRKRRLFLCFVVAMLCLAFVLLEAKIRPNLRAVVDYESRSYAITSFQQAVQTHLAANPDVYADLYTVTWDGDNVPTAVVANSYQLNLLRSELTQEVLVALYENKENIYSFHIGRLSGVQMLAAWGPVITLQMNPQSYVITEVYQTLETAGENQTLLSVYGQFTVQINVTMAGYLQTLTVENDILLWQNLLLGRVPDVNV